MKEGLFAGKKVLVMGLGRFGGGVDSAHFACRAGASVTVTDLANAEELGGSISQLKEFGDIEFHLGGHIAGDFEQADIIIANPAVAADNRFLAEARRFGKTVTSQMSIFFDLCPALIIGITGANGKSTTAALTAHLLRAGVKQEGFNYRNVWLSGNIGNEPLLTILDEIGSQDLVVLELSSFQIEQLAQEQKAPHIALLTNLLPNHLDRYGSFEKYCAAKESIFKYQKSSDRGRATSFFNADDSIGALWCEKYGEEGTRTCIKFRPDDVSEEFRGRFGLPGRANLANLAAALSIAKYLGVADETIANCLGEFKALPHRLQFIAEIDGVGWYNDSKATTPEAAIVALEAFDSPRILVAGGYDKQIPFDRLGEVIADKAKAVVLIGQTASKIARAVAKAKQNRTDVRFADSLAEAVKIAGQSAVSGDVVLLSPACASFDMFDNYQQRGTEFVRLVDELEALH